MIRPNPRMIEALQARYGRTAVVVEEVPNATGGNAKRKADAVAIGLWPSRGLFVHVYEIKTDRRDLLRELKDPEKGDEIGRLADEFWLYVTPDVTRPNDPIPPAWGIVQFDLSRSVNTRLLRKATPISDAPRALPRSFVAALIRATARQHSSADWRERTEREIANRLRVEFNKRQTDEQARLARELDDARRQLAQLKSSLGYRSPDEVAKSLRIAMSIDPKSRALQRATMLITEAAESLTRISESVAQFESALETIHAAAIQPEPTKENE